MNNFFRSSFFFSYSFVNFFSSACTVDDEVIVDSMPSISEKCSNYYFVYDSGYLNLDDLNFAFIEESDDFQDWQSCGPYSDKFPSNYFQHDDFIESSASEDIRLVGDALFVHSGDHHWSISMDDFKYSNTIDTVEYHDVISNSSTLVVADYSNIATGASLRAFDLLNGVLLWEADVRQLNISHSQYLNHVIVSLYKDKVIMEGREIGGDYIQIFDVKTGKRLFDYGFEDTKSLDVDIKNVFNSGDALGDIEGKWIAVENNAKLPEFEWVRKEQCWMDGYEFTMQIKTEKIEGNQNQTMISLNGVHSEHYEVVNISKLDSSTFKFKLLPSMDDIVDGAKETVDFSSYTWTDKGIIWKWQGENYNYFFVQEKDITNFPILYCEDQ